MSFCLRKCSVFVCKQILSLCLLSCFFYHMCLAEKSAENILETKNSETDAFRIEEQLYKALFKQKRVDQLEAVKSLANTAEFEKQFKLVSLLLKKIFEVLGKSKTIIESSSYIPGSSFPTEKNIQEALSHILENTAFFGDILLRLPDITHGILQKNREWLILVHWSMGFSTTTELYDQSSKELLNLVAQELNLIDRDPHYFNPYRRVTKVEVQQKTPFPKEKKKKKPKSRGPQLSGWRHSEL